MINNLLKIAEKNILHVNLYFTAVISLLLSSSIDNLKNNSKYITDRFGAYPFWYLVFENCDYLIFALSKLRKLYLAVIK